MEGLNMLTGIRYVVLQSNDTFKQGDHITLDDDGSLKCIEGAGWIEKEEVMNALDGCVIIPDQKWIDQQKKIYTGKLNRLKNITNNVISFGEKI